MSKQNNNFTRERAMQTLISLCALKEVVPSLERFNYFINRVTTGNFNKEEFEIFVERFFNCKDNI